MNEFFQDFGYIAFVVVIFIILYILFVTNEKKKIMADETKNDIIKFHPNIKKLKIDEYKEKEKSDIEEFHFNRNIRILEIENLYESKIKDEVNRIFSSPKEMELVSELKKQDEEYKKQNKIFEKKIDTLFLSNAIKYSDIIYSIFDGRDSISENELHSELRHRIGKNEVEIASLIKDLSDFDTGIIRKDSLKKDIFEISFRLQHEKFDTVISYEEWKKKNGK